MLTKFLDFIDERLKKTSLDFILGVGMLAYFILKMSNWGMAFATLALSKGSDLMGTAAVIGAVAAIPTGLLTLALNIYIKSWRNNDSGN